jgi:glucose/arabinose dehydrogenase
MLKYPLYLLCLICLSRGYANPIVHPVQKSDPPGQQLFNANCASCHNIANEGIGPRLGGITDLLSQSELTAFINDPDKIIKSGNERAVSLRKKYKLDMPPFAHLGPDKIKAIIAYIATETKAHQIKPLVVTKDDGLADKRLLPAIKKSGLKVDVEDFLQIPRSKDRPGDKGIATLRPYPGADGTLFVSDQMGIIYRISGAKVDTFLNIKTYISHFITEPGIGTGLGSFVFHPDFLHNGLFYTTHAEEYLGQPAENSFTDTLKAGLQWVLTEWKVNNVKDKVFKGTHRELLRINTPSTAHGVQDLGFVPNLKKGDKGYGLIYMGIGDGGSNNIKRPELADNKHSFLGTIIRIDPAGHNSHNGNYGIPADNPFAKDTDPKTKKEIYAYGFRNPHRMAWDVTPTGTRMLVADIGEANIEEINVVVNGGNYGWSGHEGDYVINTVDDLRKVYKMPANELKKYRSPFAMYDHNDGNAVSGGYVYKGPLVNLKDKYIFGDIVNGKLFYLNINKIPADHEVHELTVMQNGEETTISKLLGAKRVHLRIGYDQYTGSLYIMTKGDGKIRKITKAYY